MRTKLALSLLLVFATAPLPTLHSENWPSWRGPNGDGISSEFNLPTSWSRESNVIWRTALPEAGNSTPIVTDDLVIVTQPISEENRRSVMCFDRKTGEILWQSGIEISDQERTHRTNPHSSASPATDGERVVCWFGSGGLAAYDLTGKELWRTDLGRHNHRFGYGGSPVIHGDFVFLNFGPGTREFLVAVEKKPVLRCGGTNPRRPDRTTFMALGAHLT